MQCLMIIKPDGIPHFNEILGDVSRKAKILSIAPREVKQAEAERLYKEHEGKYFYPILLEYITMSQVYVLKVNIAPDNILELKKALRTAYRPVQFYTSCLEDFLDRGIKVNLKRFKEEFFKTFDTIHMSDPEACDKELEIFFPGEHPACASPEQFSDIIGRKLGDDFTRSETAHLYSMFDRLRYAYLASSAAPSSGASASSDDEGSDFGTRRTKSSGVL